MSIFLTHDGVQYVIKSGNANDFHNNLPAIKADIKAMREIHLGEQKWFSRPQAWDIKEHFGQTTVNVYGGEKKEEKKEEPEYKFPGLRLYYTPAFHTYDADGNWIGVTVCMGGKWGPPYKFIRCEREKIFPFEYGYWNTYDGAERPPEEYKKRLFYTDYGINAEFYEIPAIHEYCLRDGWVAGEYSSTGAWIGDYYEVLYCCTETHAMGVWHLDGSANDNYFETSTVNVITDWNIDSSECPAIVTSQYLWNRQLDIKNDTWHLYLWSEEDSCEKLLVRMVEFEDEHITPVSELEPPTANLNPGDPYGEYTHVTTRTGSYFTVNYDWGSVVEVSLASGSFLCIEQVFNTNTTIVGSEDPPLGCNSQYGIEFVSVTTEFEEFTYKASIYVLGVEYVLDSRVYTGIVSGMSSRLKDGKLRIYQAGEEIYTLANGAFRDDNSNPETEYRYCMFGGNVAQYNDTNAYYYYDGYIFKHHPGLISIGEDEEEIFTNGEFLLVQIKQII